MIFFAEWYSKIHFLLIFFERKLFADLEKCKKTSDPIVAVDGNVPQDSSILVDPECSSAAIVACFSEFYGPPGEGGGYILKTIY